MRSKAVFDSYVYVAATLLPGSIYDSWLDTAINPDGAFRLFSSQQILSDVNVKLVKAGFSSEDATSTIQALSQRVNVVEVPQRDALADMVCECARTCEANFIVAGDPELLGRKQCDGIGIYHPDDVKIVFPK